MNFTQSRRTPIQQSALPILCHAFGKTLPCYWQTSAMLMARPCHPIGKTLPSQWQNHKAMKQSSTLGITGSITTSVYPLFLRNCFKASISFPFSFRVR